MPLSLHEQRVDSTAGPLIVGLDAALGAEAPALDQALFLRASARETNSRHRFTLGSIPSLQRYTVCHRYEPFWMKPRAGSALADVPPETQYLLAELEGARWLLLVPLFEEPFRFSLRGTREDTLELLGETNDAFSFGSGGLALFVAVGDDPFVLAREGARAVAARLGSGRLRAEKRLPDFARQFGWCTWDAFYQEVSESKLRQGLESFAAGGVSPRMLILDDGWQSTARAPSGEKRLTGFAPNHKFPDGLAPTVRLAKQQFSVETFLVWHAVIGYWGGVDGSSLPGYDVVDQVRSFGEGVLAHMPNFNQDWWGSLVGYVPESRIAQFYDDYHRSLASAGVDGVKVDNQAVLEGMGQRQGGRVRINRFYRAALEQSVRRHFDGRLINCMSNAQETWYGSPDSTLLRSSVDFWPKLPESHGVHLYTNAQVGLWFGEFMHPDWDMFQSGHEWGRFHAAGRAVSGGPVDGSDKPESHDCELLKQLVCSDGSVLLCDGPGLPTADVLCHDPTREHLLLKIWNRNGPAGIVGAFHCQYATNGVRGGPISGETGPADVPGLEGSSFACYAHEAGTLERLARDERRSLALEQGSFELFTFAPIRDGFAAIGLADKLNSAGALLRVQASPHGFEVELRDGGRFLAFSERAPRAVAAGGSAVPFSYDSAAHSLTVSLGPGRQTLSIAY